MTTRYTAHEKDALQRLGEDMMRIGSLPGQAATAGLWRRLNDREPVRPLVYINEEPWPELEDESLACVCTDPFLRQVETGLRRTLYRWRHYPVDNVVRPFVECPKAWSSTDIGISQKATYIHHSAVKSQHFEAQIKDMEDIALIRKPEVRHDEAETARRQALLEEIFDGVVPVRVTGVRHIWFTPWDFLIRLVDLEGIMIDLIERPEFVEALVARYVDAKMHELDEIERLGLLDAGAANVRVGSGGYGYTSALPADGEPGRRLSCRDLWGCGNAQIFSEVSPAMHWDFSLKHELRWLERWGLTYYGCCEPLHMKIGILKKIPNLRKLSVSPWFNIPAGLEQGAGDYVLSVKPNPAVLAGDRFNAERARADIRALLDQAAGCPVELIMKDISTVRNDPARLAEWASIAMDEVQRA
ncbi:MAG: hypothetical protein JW951_04930 [Lentisphaerae bacterium]|nr:hypothetical protein [Lentisphaerota bacterium]